MFNQIETQGTFTNSLFDDYLPTWMEGFLIDRKARGLAGGTLRFYCIKLKLFTDFCETQVFTQIGQITPTLLRQTHISQIAIRSQSPTAQLLY